MMERRKAQGKSTPALESRPTLHPDLLLFWEAFVDLSGARTHHQGWYQPIQFTEIQAWVHLNNIESIEDREIIARLVRAMDCEWLKLAYAETEKRMKAESAKAKGKGRLKCRR